MDVEQYLRELQIAMAGDRDALSKGPGFAGVSNPIFDVRYSELVVRYVHVSPLTERLPCRITRYRNKQGIEK